MITAVDTNVLLDIFIPDDQHGPQSRELVRVAYENGAVAICDVVYAELAPSFTDRDALDKALSEIGIALSPIDSAIAYEAGMRWQLYRAAGGPRQRIMADFLIGAHALRSSDAFLTRDQGFFTTYFPELDVVSAGR